MSFYVYLSLNIEYVRTYDGHTYVDKNAWKHENPHYLTNQIMTFELFLSIKGANNNV
jgi:hypothetical protein